MSEIPTTVEFVGGPLDGSLRSLADVDGFGFLETQMEDEEMVTCLLHLYVISFFELTESGNVRAEYFSLETATYSLEELMEESGTYEVEESGDDE